MTFEDTRMAELANDFILCSARPIRDGEENGGLSDARVGRDSCAR
jgi:hypothetical protein